MIVDGWELLEGDVVLLANGAVGRIFFLDTTYGKIAFSNSWRSFTHAEVVAIIKLEVRPGRTVTWYR